MPRSPCKANQIRNPATGRCVKRNGSIGRKIRSKSRSPVKRQSPCKPNQIRNPATGRCVKRNGSIGRKIRSLSPDSKRDAVLKMLVTDVNHPLLAQFIRGQDKIASEVLISELNRL